MTTKPTTLQEVQRTDLWWFAYSDGRRAGALLLSPEMNPHTDQNSPLHDAWKLGRFSGLSQTIERGRISRRREDERRAA